ncbi:MAG: hypothetical protein GC193_04840 [Cryomorphaceae bacterium]|nr:hypothetical protein [Cryomorphaceae bacterium]
MKTIVLIISSFLAVSVSGQLSQIVVEQFALTGPESEQPEGTVTYRVYAELMQSNDKVVSVFASDNCHSLDISTSTHFFNHDFGAIYGSTINSGFYFFFPTYEADSWVTIGAANSTVFGAMDVEISVASSDLFNNSFGVNNPEGSSFVLNDGLWFTSANSQTALPVGPDNRVLIGQFTTSGQLSFHLNMRVLIGGDEVNGIVDYVWNESCNEASNLTGFEQYHSQLTYGECNDINACNYSTNSTTDEFCTYIEGCMNPDFCAYNPLACIDTGCLPNNEGCINENAINYDPLATCPTPCTFNFHGTVYHDSNINGVLDEGETGIPMQQLNFSQGSNLVVYTDENGSFSVELEELSTLLNLTFNPSFPFITNSQFPFTINPSQINGPFNIGLSFDVPNFSFESEIFSLFGGALCGSATPIVVSVENNSNVP